MTDRVDIRFEPFQINGTVPKKMTVFQAAMDLGIPIRSDCGQKGTCAKCCVVPDNPGHLSLPTSIEKKILTKDAAASSQRLACQAKITGPVTFTIPKDLAITEEVSGKTGIKGSFPVNAATTRYHISKEALNISGSEDIPGLSEKILSAVEKECNKPIGFDPALSLGDVSSNKLVSSGITAVLHEKKGITAVLEGLRQTSLGMAFDIGTTTIAGYLCHLKSGNIIASKAAINPQRPFGEDVISRIAAISEDEACLAKLQELVISAMNRLMDECLDIAGYAKEDIDEITVVGNTTMEHIFANLNPKSIGVYPYVPMTYQSMLPAASELDMNLSAATPCYIFPVISGFLGGDILSALLADQSFNRKDTTLIIDIGTNGELLLHSEKGIWATSCATGPALEGAQISCGMRAAKGAINEVFVDEKDTNKLIFKTIGNKKPIGICGSGIIDALAAMRKAGITKENGTFNLDVSGVEIDKNNVGKSFKIPKTRLHITLKDVRQVQLAKAALFVGIESLLKNAGIEKVDRTILTGAFGATFNWKNARDIGMLPPSILNGKVKSAQNLAGQGAIMALLDKHQRTKIEAVAKKIIFLDLAAEPDFTMKFSNATQFPDLK